MITHKRVSEVERAMQFVARATSRRVDERDGDDVQDVVDDHVRDENVQRDDDRLVVGHVRW